MSRSGGRARARGWAAAGLLGASLIVAAALAGPPASDGPPLDPASPGRLGTKGLVDVLRALGAAVDVSADVPAPGEARSALVLADVLDARGRDRLAAFVAGGGTLVVADTGSVLNPFSVEGGTGVGILDADIERRCDLPALAQARRVSAPGGQVLEAPAGTTGCFPRNDGHWLVAWDRGPGTLVVVGGAGPFTNGQLDDADNALVAVSLLAPRRGDRVVVVRPPPPGAGDEGLADLVAPPVKMALAQLGVAFGVLAAWRARRLGRPVVEPQPVQLEGSELVRAVGDLLQRARRRDRAAALLRDDLRRDLARHLGLPPSAPHDVVAEVAAARTGAERARVAAALDGGAPGGEGELVALARLVEEVREEVLGAGV